MIRVRFLGTAAARPTVARNVSGIAVQREGESFLWDCGEGTQRQIMRYGSGFSFSHIFITHAHADHFLGIPGLLRTMGLQGREEPMTVYGPAGSGPLLEAAVRMGVERLHFPVHVRSLEDGERVDFRGWAVHAFAVDHGVAAFGYALVEEARLGRFDVEAVRRLGVPEGPLYGRLHRGETIEMDGRVISPDDVVGQPRPGRKVVYSGGTPPDDVAGQPRPGRKVVYSGDTRPNRRTVEMAVGADLLIHEATFGADEDKRARETRHSTAAEAASVAARARTRQLVLTHISARYSDAPRLLRRQARAVFAATEVAHDGLELEIGYRE